MTESSTPSKSFKIVHWGAIVFLFLMLAQPTFSNISALFTGELAMGDLTIEVTLSQMALHILAMIIGWVGFLWFVKRQKRGAYLSIAAHLLGFVAVLTQTPDMLDAMPQAALVGFFVLLFAIALGPIFAFKSEYS